ncbi:anthocyanidin 5,3-O-glucosyltransferase-like [Iris pallida]|uniref:Anthocyanidin 5,3-O-glucosyltransferase-like n=1 Tax=Iris pallida TaxID=29817 RepID=A0AAX6GPB9_IRIPA|nr:anthocyanidin 5,3-O-glucosyltransferase-like [Iris pallida]
MIGTPELTASSVEFHPQWLTNPPTDLCARTAACGAHDFTTIPFPFVRSKNPSGSRASKSGSGLVPGRAAGSSFSGGLRTTQRNRCPLRSSPMAISFTCSAENEPMLPKHKNTTLFSGCASSHARHSCLSPSPSPPLLPFATNGPMQ